MNVGIPFLWHNKETYHHLWFLQHNHTFGGVGVAGYPVLVYYIALCLKIIDMACLLVFQQPNNHPYHPQVALGVAGYPVLIYHIAECCCHLGLAASVFLTIAITLERYQVSSTMYFVTGIKVPRTRYQVPSAGIPSTLYKISSTMYPVPGVRGYYELGLISK